MKKLFSILFLGLLLGFTGLAQVKIGLPAGAPQSSAVLDLSNTGDGTRALILPRVASTAAVVLPVQGMLVYDISTNTIKAYENSAWVSYSSQSSSTSAVNVNCGSSSINGFYSQGTLLTSANTVTIVVANNSFSPVTINAAVGDIVLSGPGAAGITVASVNPTSVNPGSGGGTSNIVYTLSGTPTTLGSFTATWTKVSLSCAKTGAVCLPVSPLTITNTTSPSTLPPTIAAGNWIDFTAAGGLNNTGVSWVMSSTPATGMFSSPTTGTGTTARAVLMANASGVVTVVFTATNPCGLLVTQTQTVSAGALYVDCPTSAINGIYTQGRALTASNTITMKVVNNALSANTVNAAPGDIELTGANAGMTVASVLPTSSTIPANGGSTTFTYTLSGTPTAVGALTATYTNGTLTCAKTGTVCLDISPVTVSSVTSPATLPVPIVAGNTVNFTAAGGTNNTGISWVMSSSPAIGIFTNTATGTGTTATAILAANAIGVITITFTATNACGLLVIGAQTLSVGEALRGALVAAAGAGACTSCAAYDAAAVNDYVQVTMAEYDNLTTTVVGINNFGMKLADRNLGVGTAAYTNYMFLNNIPTTAIPFAFSTKLDGSASCVRLITQSSITIGAPAEVAWGLAAGVTVASGAATTVYFVIKKPTILMPANTNIAVKGYFNGWGGSGGTGADGASGTAASTTSGANSGRECTLTSTTVNVLSPAGLFPAATYLNYDIKWTTSKQW